MAGDLPYSSASSQMIYVTVVTIVKFGYFENVFDPYFQSQREI